MLNAIQIAPFAYVQQKWWKQNRCYKVKIKSFKQLLSKKLVIG